MNRKSQQKEENRLKIYETALGLFARYGFKKTTVEDIASALGYTKGNLYLYVKDKQDLYEKTVAFALERWQSSVLGKIPSEGSIIERVLEACRISFAYLSQDNDLREVLRQDPSIMTITDKEDRFYEINEASRNILKLLLQEGINQGAFKKVDINLTVDFLYSVYIMFIIKAYIKPENKSTEELFENALQLILNGLIAS